MVPNGDGVTRGVHRDLNKYTFRVIWQKSSGLEGITTMLGSAWALDL